MNEENKIELQSEALDKIAPALIAARKNIYGAVKNGKGNWGAYASLEDLVEAINDPLLDENIVVTQPGCTIDGHPHIITQATHSSGQFMRSLTKIENPKPGDPQKALAAQTYTRRAGLESLFNIPRVDDDGEHGKTNGNGNGKKEQKPSSSSTLTNGNASANSNNGERVHKSKADAFLNFGKALGLDPDKDIKVYLQKNGIDTAYDIPVDKFDLLREGLKEIEKAA